MPGFLDSFLLTADSLDKLGQTGPQTNDAGTLLTPNSASAPGGILVGRSDVETGYKHVLKSILLSAWHQSGVTAQDNTAGLNLGKVEILINGAVAFEFLSMDVMAVSPAGGDELVSEMYNANQQFNFGDGFVVSAGQAVLVRVSPARKIPIRWCMDLYGSETQHATAVTYTTTANQVLLNYTPASDWTIKGLAFSSDTPGQVLGQMRLEKDGIPFFNTGDIGQDENTCGSMCNNWNSIAGYGMGGLFIPCWGMELQQETKITCFAHPWSAVNGKFQFIVFGDKVAYNTGGGGNTYSRGRVVNA